MANNTAQIANLQAAIAQNQKMIDMTSDPATKAIYQNAILGQQNNLAALTPGGAPSASGDSSLGTATQGTQSLLLDQNGALGDTSNAGTGGIADLSQNFPSVDNTQEIDSGNNATNFVPGPDSYAQQASSPAPSMLYGPPTPTAPSQPGQHGSSITLGGSAYTPQLPAANAVLQAAAAPQLAALTATDIGFGAQRQTLLNQTKGKVQVAFGANADDSSTPSINKPTLLGI